jgi:hypothetical protein
MVQEGGLNRLYIPIKKRHATSLTAKPNQNGALKWNFFIQTFTSDLKMIIFYERIQYKFWLL